MPLYFRDIYTLRLLYIIYSFALLRIFASNIYINHWFIIVMNTVFITMVAPYSTYPHCAPCDPVSISGKHKKLLLRKEVIAYGNYLFKIFHYLCQRSRKLMPSMQAQSVTSLSTTNACSLPFTPALDKHCRSRASSTTANNLNI